MRLDTIWILFVCLLASNLEEIEDYEGFARKRDEFKNDEFKKKEDDGKFWKTFKRKTEQG